MTGVIFGDNFLKTLGRIFHRQIVVRQIESIQVTHIVTRGWPCLTESSGHLADDTHLPVMVRKTNLWDIVS